MTGSVPPEALQPPGSPAATQHENSNAVPRQQCSTRTATQHIQPDSTAARMYSTADPPTQQAACSKSASVACSTYRAYQCSCNRPCKLHGYPRSGRDSHTPHSNVDAARCWPCSPRSFVHALVAIPYSQGKKCGCAHAVY
eukprot:364774-Chlamydomonas_euryale.AAC.1